MLFLSCFAATSRSQEKALTPEQKRLEVFIGRWTIPGSEKTYLEICHAIQGGHIQCNAVDTESSKADSSVSYLSWILSEKAYVYYGLYSSGSSRTLRGQWINDHFMLEGERILPEKKTKWRVAITPVNNDLQFKEEASVNGGEWQVKADFLYKRMD